MMIVITVSLKMNVTSRTKTVFGMKIAGMTNTMTPTMSILTVPGSTILIMRTGSTKKVTMTGVMITIGMEPNGSIVELDSYLLNSPA